MEHLTDSKDAELCSGPAFAVHQQVLAQRWNTAMTATGFDRVVVAAGSATNYFFDDQAPPFKPNPHFAQFLPGVNGEHCELIVRPAQQPLLLFYQPADYWHQPPAIPAWANEHFELEIHHDTEALARSRDQHLAGHNAVASIAPHAAPDSLANSAASHNPAALLSQLDYLRATKTPFEVAAMRAATERGVAGHIAAARVFDDRGSEYQMYMAFLAASGNTPGELPYSSIVALNEHAGVLHYQHYDRAAPTRHYSFLIDAGAAALGYASDITRTYAGDAPSEFGELIEALDAAQQQLITGITAGTGYADLHVAMIDTIAGLLCASGILTCSTQQAIDARLADPFMPHGLGHLIGLQTHDVGGQQRDASGATRPPVERFPALRLTRALATDALFTIEPGVYFIPLLLDAVRAGPNQANYNWPLIDALTPCGGIRIEDNVWLSAAGPVNLTRDAFATAQAGR